MSDAREARLASIRARASRDLAALTCEPVPSAMEQERIVDVAWLLDEVERLTAERDELDERLVWTTRRMASCERWADRWKAYAKKCRATIATIPTLARTLQRARNLERNARFCGGDDE